MDAGEQDERFASVELWQGIIRSSRRNIRPIREQHRLRTAALHLDVLHLGEAFQP